MSKLTDRLNKVGQSAPSPIGFGTASRRQEEPTILLIGQTTAEDLLKSGAKVTDDLDAVIVSTDKVDAGHLEKIGAALEGHVWGIETASIDGEGAELIEEKGADFVVFAPEGTSAAVLNVEELGKILTVGSDLDEDTGSGIQGLEIDALKLSLDSDLQPLTVAKLIELQTIQGVTNSPVILVVPSELNSGEIESLRDIGISALLVDLSAGEQAANLKETIMNLPRRRSRSRSRSRDAAVPQVAPEDESEEE